MIRNLSAPERIVRCRTALLLNPQNAFFGALAMGLRLEPAPHISSMGTNGETLAYNPPWVESASESDLSAVIAHEILHVSRLHHVRRGSRDLATWNRACDYSINPDLVKAGFKLPAGAFIDSRYAGMHPEEIYSALRHEEQQKPEPEEEDDDDSDDETGGGEPAASHPGDDESDASAPGKPDAGPSTVPAVPDPAGTGGIYDPAPDAAGIEEARTQAEINVRQAISAATRANGGELPEFLKRTVDAIQAPRIAWRDELSDFATEAGEVALAWDRPNKRFLEEDFFMPGNKPDGISRAVAVVDSSGSVTQEDLDALAPELQGMLESGRIGALEVFYCHAATHGGQTFVPGDTVRLQIEETGGTAFGPAFRRIEEEYPDAGAIIYLTDLEPYGPDAWGEEPAAPLLWAVIGSQRKAPFGRVLPIDPYS